MCMDDNFKAMDRRHLLKTLGALGATMLAGCGASSFSSTSASSSTGATTTGAIDLSACVVPNDETNGPYPADGSNSAGDGSSAKLDDVSSSSTIVRSSIAEGLAGIPLTLQIGLGSSTTSCSALAGYYIYVWHCTAGGIYSAYSGQAGSSSHSRTETYMRGIQQTNAYGLVTFNTIYPGWYSGRAVHIHVEIYANLDGSPVKTTQIAFPMTVTRTVNAVTAAGYKGAGGLMENSADGIFSDGTANEMLTVTGNTTDGYVGAIAFAV